MQLIERRVGRLFGFFLVLLALAAVRTAQLGIANGSKLSHAAASQQVSTVEIPAPRGTIVDRNGVQLAVSEPADDVAATPYLVKDPLATAKALAPVLGVAEDALLRKLARRDTGFVYLARLLPANRAEQISSLKVGGKELVGITLLPTGKRVYPRASLASQVLGTVGTDNVGLAGLEYSQDKALRGRAGERRLVKDALGRPIEIRDTRPTRPGAGLRLTIDSVLQSKVEDVLATLGATYRPKGATAIVMDPRDGSILALANWPRVDANDVGGAPPYARQDRAVGFNYEPGSTFKAFTVAGALEKGLVAPDTSFSLPSTIQVADRVIGEAHARGAITLTTAQILAQSSNVGAIMIGLREGRSAFDSWLHRFGFGAPTGVDLPGEERGQVLPLAKYSGSTMGNLPIGQGLSVTPMQMAAGYSAIANGGILRPPHVVAAIGGHPVREPRGHRVLSSSTTASLRHMLEGVFAAGGTASEVSVPGYALAGKTGTANKIDPATGEYSSSRFVASFVGFAPARHPRLLAAVMADEPQGAIYGGVVAAPAFGKIMAFALPYLGIAPQ